MKAVRKTFLCKLMKYLLIVVLVSAMIPVIPGEAASTKSKALAAYKKKLSQSTVAVLPKGKKVIDLDYNYAPYKPSKRANVKFAIAYIDNNNVPELILQDKKYGYGVWTYTGGKVKCVHWEDCYGAPYGYYKKKGIYEDIVYSEGSPFTKCFYQFKNGKMKEKLNKFLEYEDDTNPEYSMVSSSKYKQISKSTFKKKLKSYVGNTHVTKIKMRSNTSSNRKKYLK